MSFKEKLRSTGRPDADKIAEAIAAGSKAPGTVARYKSVAAKFVEFQSTLPREANLEAAVALFIHDQPQASAANFRAVRAALIWHFDVLGVTPNPAKTPITAMAVEAASRQAPVPMHRGKVSPQMVRSIVQWAAVSRSRQDKRFAVFAVTAFGGFFRPNEALGIRVAHLQFTDTELQISLQKSKKNQFGPAEIIRIARGAGRGFCPVDYVRQWVQDPGRADSQWLFPSFSGPDRKWSYDALRKHMLQLIQRGKLPQGISPHSFRGGAATEAAEQGIPVDSIARAGRWRSIQSTAPYIATSRGTLRGADSLLTRLW